MILFQRCGAIQEVQFICNILNSALFILNIYFMIKFNRNDGFGFEGGNIARGCLNRLHPCDGYLNLQTAIAIY